MIRIDFELLSPLPRLLIPEGNPNRWLETENKEQREQLEGAIATFRLLFISCYSIVIDLLNISIIIYKYNI